MEDFSSLSSESDLSNLSDLSDLFGLGLAPDGYQYQDQGEAAGRNTRSYHLLSSQILTAKPLLS